MQNTLVLKLSIAFLFTACFVQPLGAQTLKWVTSSGNASVIDAAWDIAIDNDNNSYIAGRFRDTIFFSNNPGGSFLPSDALTYKTFVAKRDSVGNYVWAFGLNTNSDFTHIELSPAKDAIYIAGNFLGSIDFDPGTGINIPGTIGVYIAKYDLNSNLIWVKVLGDEGECNDFDVDAFGNINICGKSMGGDFDPGVGTVNLVSNGTENGFFAKYTDAGDYIYAHNLGSTFTYEEVKRIDSDSTGNVYVCGPLGDTIDFNVGAGVAELFTTATEGSATYIAKYDNAGNYLWAEKIRIPIVEGLLSVEKSGDFILLGHFPDSVNLDPADTTQWLFDSNITFWFEGNFFIAKYNSNGDYMWAKSIEYDLGSMYIEALTHDHNNNIYIGGYYKGTVNMEPSTGIYIDTALYVTALLATYDTYGNCIQFKSLPGTPAGQILPYAIAVNDNNDLFITGYFNDTCDFDFEAPVVNAVEFGNNDVFTARYANNLTSINTPENNITIGVYPNPAKHYFTLCNLPNGLNHIKLYDCFGKCVFNTSTYTNMVPLEVQLPNGIYVVQVSNSTNRWQTKLVISN